MTREFFANLDRRHWLRLADGLILVALLYAAIYITYRTGRKGFFAFDQSIVFDGAYRVLSGQVPYEDFLGPFGPVVFWIQAVFFRFLGVNYFAYIAGAALVNALAVLLVVLLIRLLYPQRKWLSYVAGGLTAIWFYPPFGTPWPDQTAIFFALVGTFTILAGVFLGPSGRSRYVSLFVAGLFFSVSFFSKQNIGLYSLIVPLAVLAAAFLPHARNFVFALATTLVGVLAGVLLFASWLALFSDVSNFVEYFLVIPSEVGRSRLFRAAPTSLASMLFTEGPIEVRLLMWSAIALCGVQVVRMVRVRAWRYERNRRRVAALALALSLIFFQYAYIYTSNNVIENGFQVSGVIATLSLATLLPVLHGETAETSAQKPKARGKRRVWFGPRAIAILSMMALVVAASLRGLVVGRERVVHGGFRSSEFGGALSAPKLNLLVWGEPTSVGQFVWSRDINGLMEFLQDEGKPFFVFPDFTWFYGLLNAPSPQPVLWFHPGLTYRVPVDPELDRWIVSSLVENGVEIVVLEESSWFGTVERLNDFPELREFIETRFVRVRRFGNFIILEKGGEQG